MNSDEFEKKLARQKFRGVPTEWRAVILQGAVHAVHTTRPAGQGEGGNASWWRELLWPCPQAWAALAAAWVCILGLNAAIGEDAPARKSSESFQREAAMAITERRRELAELLDLVEPPQDRLEIPPKPRSENNQPWLTG